MLSEGVLTQLILVVGSIITTYLTVKYGKKIRKKFQESPPKDRIDNIFDGYEALIKQQQADIDRKSNEIAQTQQIINRLQAELNESQTLVNKLRADLENTKTHNKELQDQLAEMRVTYAKSVAE